MIKRDEDKIPIIFVYNGCVDKVFEDRKKKVKIDEECENTYLDLLKKIEQHLTEDEEENKKIRFTDNNIYLKFPINCYKKKGFVELFDAIYNKFKGRKIKNDIINELEKGTIYGENKYNLNNLGEKNEFFKNIEFEDIISPQMEASVELIKIIILRLTGQYSDKLGFFDNIKFKIIRFQNILKKYIGFGRPNNEYFPLLTDLVLKIYNIFGEENDLTNCNTYIKDIIYDYFKILDDNDKLNYDNFKNDIRNYRYLFQETKKNFGKDISENILEKGKFHIEENKYSDIGKFFLEQEKKFYEFEIEKLILKTNNINSINDEETNYINDEEKRENDEIKEQSEIIEENQINLIDSDSEIIKRKDSVDSINIYDLDYRNNFDNILERITNYFKKKFEDYHGDNIMDNRRDKILIKIFIINLVCKKLTEELCKKYHSAQNVWDFYKNIAYKYNESIEGLNKIKEYFEKENN